MKSALALLLLGCTGGQTGEITELSLCERVVERLPVTDLPAHTREALGAATAPHETELTWSEDGSSSAIVIDAELETETADRIGPHPCAPIVRLPVRVHLSTADGRVELDVHGLADVLGDAVTVQGGARVTSLGGRDMLEAETEVWLWMEQTPDSFRGELSFGGTPAAAF
jgi:hypothetical protein